MRAGPGVSTMRPCPQAARVSEATWLGLSYNTIRASRAFHFAGAADEAAQPSVCSIVAYSHCCPDFRCHHDEVFSPAARILLHGVSRWGVLRKSPTELA